MSSRTVMVRLDFGWVSFTVANGDSLQRRAAQLRFDGQVLLELGLVGHGRRAGQRRHPHADPVTGHRQEKRLDEPCQVRCLLFNVRPDAYTEPRVVEDSTLWAAVTPEDHGTGTVGIWLLVADVHVLRESLATISEQLAEAAGGP